jgi:hypothetical protein
MDEGRGMMEDTDGFFDYALSFAAFTVRPLVACYHRDARKAIAD